MKPTSHRFRFLLRHGATVAAVILLGACDSGKSSQTTAPSAPLDTAAQQQRARTLQTLADEDATDEARLESIHSARDLQLSDATPELRKLLKTDTPDIIVAAAAALDGLNAKDADLALMEAAGHLGRARQFEHLRQLLYIIGSVGGPRARTYLETVADGHELPAIRDTAAQILREMNASSHR